MVPFLLGSTRGLWHANGSIQETCSLRWKTVYPEMASIPPGHQLHREAMIPLTGRHCTPAIQAEAGGPISMWSRPGLPRETLFYTQTHIRTYLPTYTHTHTQCKGSFYSIQGLFSEHLFLKINDERYTQAPLTYYETAPH